MKTWLAFVAIGKSQLIERGFRDHQERIKILHLYILYKIYIRTS